MDKGVVFTPKELKHLRKAESAKTPQLTAKEGAEFFRVRAKNMFIRRWADLYEKNGKVTTSDLSKQATDLYEDIVEDWKYSPMMLSVSRAMKLDEAKVYDILVAAYAKAKPEVVRMVKRRVEKKVQAESVESPVLAHYVDEDIA